MDSYNGWFPTIQSTPPRNKNVLVWAYGGRVLRARYFEEFDHAASFVLDSLTLLDKSEVPFWRHLPIGPYGEDPK